MPTLLGYVVGGSLQEGLTIRLETHINPETIKTGKFVSIVGNTYRFFCIITDLQLHVTNPDIVTYPPTISETLLHSILRTRDLYATACVKPMVMVDQHNRVVPVKTIPWHFSSVYEATEQDVSLIFGSEKDASGNYFMIGTPLDMTTAVCINLERITQRSNGIFGKTGTGKTFITRVLLAGLMKHQKAVNLIFDMHSEYGLQARQEKSSHAFVKGLKTLFPHQTAIFSLDPTSTRRRGGSADVSVIIGYDAIQVDDILSLQDELNLHSTAVEAAYLIAAKYKQQWLSTLLTQGDGLKKLADEVGAHPESITALYRKLKRIERLPFFVHQHPDNMIDQLMEYINRGISIIIEFGNYTSTFSYLLVANIITRRIHQEYVARTEQFLGSGKADDEPRQLLITIEEAHKFLNPNAARQTIFGTIAREMRKYYVSLLIVDQRPSEIDPEICSQIGTKIVAQLNDEKDIHAVLTGTANSSILRTVLASLDSKKQALVFGHAITMPIVIETRTYDELFYKQMGFTYTTTNAKGLIQEIF